LQERRENHHGRSRLQQGLALNSRNRRERNGPDEVDGQQNQESESKSKDQSDQGTANGQRGHTTYSIQATAFSSARYPKIGLIQLVEIARNADSAAASSSSGFFRVDINRSQPCI